MNKELDIYFKSKGINHSCIFAANSQLSLLEVVQFIENNKIDFHVLLRQTVKNKFDLLEMNFDLNDERVSLDNRKSILCEDENTWYDMVIDDEIHIGFSDEPVGTQLEFDNVICLEALKISDELLTKIEMISGDKGEIVLVANISSEFKVNRWE